MLAKIQLQSFSAMPTESDINNGYVIAVTHDGYIRNVLYTPEYGWNTFKPKGIKESEVNHNAALSAQQMEACYAGWVSYNTPCITEITAQDLRDDSPDWNSLLEDLIGIAEKDFQQKLDRYNSLTLFSSMTASGDELATALNDQNEMIKKLKEAVRHVRRRD